MAILTTWPSITASSTVLGGSSWNSGRFRSTRPLALFLLGLFAFLALFALVIFAFLALCALVLFAFLALCALVLFAFLALFALFLFALIALLALVLFALIALFALVLFALIALFALVPCAFRTLFVVDDRLLTCASRVSCTLGSLQRIFARRLCCDPATGPGDRIFPGARYSRCSGKSV